MPHAAGWELQTPIPPPRDSGPKKLSPDAGTGRTGAFPGPCLPLPWMAGPPHHASWASWQAMATRTR